MRSATHTVTKVGKSDCEGAFAGVSGNDADALIPGVPALAPERGGNLKLSFAAREISVGAKCAERCLQNVQSSKRNVA